MWNLVTQEMDSAEFVRRTDDKPLTSPRYDDLNEATRKQVDSTTKAMRLLVKAGIVGEGQIRIQASGHMHHENQQPADQQSATYVAISIGRVSE